MMTGESWRLDVDAFSERFMLGLEGFGPYADWLWAMPALWTATAIALWLYVGWQQRRSDRAYLDYASRNLSLLRRIARQRAQEVAYSRRSDRF